MQGHKGHEEELQTDSSGRAQRTQAFNYYKTYSRTLQLNPFSITADRGGKGGEHDEPADYQPESANSGGGVGGFEIHSENARDSSDCSEHEAQESQPADQHVGRLRHPGRKQIE